MKVLLAAIFVIVLPGCVFQNTSGYEMKLAQKACEEYGGVHTTTSYFYGGFTVYCNGRKQDPLGTSRMSFDKDTIENQLLSNQL